VDEATKHVMTLDVQGRGSGGDRAVRYGYAEIDSPVRALLVVMPDVAANDPFEVPLT
jgi:hypothetical protein